MGLTDKTVGGPEKPNRSFSAVLRPQSYRALIGPVLCLAVAAWGFLTGRGYVLLVLGTLLLFMLLAAALTSVFWWLAGGNFGRPDRVSGTARKTLILTLLFTVAMLTGGEFAGCSNQSGSRSPGSVASGPAPAAGRDFANLAYAWRGIRMVLVNPAIASRTGHPSEAGMRVVRIAAGSAAAAGLRPGDIVTALDGMPVDTARGLALAIADRPAGSNVRLSVWQGDLRQEIAMSLAAPTAQVLAVRDISSRPAA
jgi:PDZ domain